MGDNNNDSFWNNIRKESHKFNPQKVDISGKEWRKKKEDRTRFDFQPNTNPIDKALMELQVILGKPIFITSGNRAETSTAGTVNHNEKQKARDIGIASNEYYIDEKGNKVKNLTKADFRFIATYLASKGFRIGDAINTNAPHIHIDSYEPYSKHDNGTRGSHLFTEGGPKSYIWDAAEVGYGQYKQEWLFEQYKQGNAGTSQKLLGVATDVVITPEQVNEFEKRITKDVPSQVELDAQLERIKEDTIEGLVLPDDDESLNDMNVLLGEEAPKIDSENLMSMSEAEEEIMTQPQPKISNKVKRNFSSLMEGLAFIEPNQDTTGQNVQAVLENKPENYIPQIKPNTPILADTSTEPLQTETVVEPMETQDDISISTGEATITEANMDELSIRPTPAEEIDRSFKGDFGAKPQDFSNVITDLENLTFEGMGNDLVNNFVDRSVVGFISQGVIRRTETTDKVDPNFIPTEDPLYPELTKGLDNEDLEEVLKNSNNTHDFIVNATMMQNRNQRSKEMQEYAKDHPVLSGANVIGNILAEGAIFMPVSSLASAAVGATKIKRARDLVQASRIGKYAVGELVEQGLQEVIWSQNAKDYEFDPLLFSTSIGLGVGLKTLIGSPELDKAFRDLLKDERGFINITTEKGKKLVDEVARKVRTEEAVRLAEAITKKKAFAANVIRKNLEAERKGITQALNKLNRQIKSTKDRDLKKKLKGKKQRLVRRRKAFDKRLPTQLRQLAKGIHPKLTAEINPKLSITEIAKELGIDSKLVNTPDKIRKYLGLDSPKIDPDFVVEGEKAYKQVFRTQAKEMNKNTRLNANETIRYMAGSDVVKSIDKLPLLGKLQIGDKLRALAETDGPISRFLFNKGNLVSSENPLVSTFYNWLAPDGMGRQGMSKIRAIESQQKYANIYGGYLMDIYHTHGDRLYKLLEGDVIKTKAKAFFSPDSFEETVEPLFKERMLLGKEGFRVKYGDEIADIADDFADDFNKLNKKIVDRAKEVGVEGVDFESTTDWFTRSWDFRKTRAVDLEDLQDTIFRAMKSHAEKLGVKSIDEEKLLNHAKRFAYGVRNADLSTIEGLQSDHIKLLTRLLDKAKGDEAKVIKTEIERLKLLKAKADAGDLANRVQMDVTQKMSNGLQLSDLFEDNIVHTQKRYTARMSARIAAAEHGIKNIDTMDDWVKDAVEEEIKRLAAKGVKNPAESAKFVEQSMIQDLNSFKYGGMVGLHDLPDDSANDLLRLVKKYNYARLMQYTGLSSLAELNGTFVEAGVSTTLRELGRTMRQHFNDLYSDNPEKYVDRLYDELRTVTGVGMEDFSFSTKGMSQATRINEEGVLNTFEKGIDVLGRMAHGPFGGIEKTGRRMTANALAIKWANYFTGREKGGLLSAFFGSNGVTNRVLENSGLGRMTKTGKFIPNKTYKDIQKSIKKFATFDERGNLVKLNLDKWNTDTAHAFGDAIQMQANHITINPDATTMALWQSTTVGQILNQFRTFTINATTKVMGQTIANAVISSNRGDQSEMIKAGQKIFWGTSLGMLSVALRQGIQRAGGDEEVDLFDDGIMKAAAIGFSRSSVAGNLPTLIDSVGTTFGYDPIFEKTSSIGRSKNFFNLATTPTGQAVHGVYKSGEKAAQGDFKGAGMKLLKTSPLYRQIGAQQIFNYIDDEK